MLGPLIKKRRGETIDGGNVTKNLSPARILASPERQFSTLVTIGGTSMPSGTNFACSAYLPRKIKQTAA